MFRVFDTEKKQWIKDEIYLAPNGDLYMIKQSIFGLVKKPIILSPDRYVYHHDIGLYDKNKELMYVGDFVEAQVDEDKVIRGMITYAHELASYIILCPDIEQFYLISIEVCEFIRVIGNVFDGYNEDINDGQQTLQQEENQTREVN